MKINIATQASGPTEYALIGTPSMSVGQRVEIAPGVEATWLGTMAYKSFDVPSVIEFAVVVAGGVLGNVVGDAITGWLRRGTKEPPVYIQINDVRIDAFDEKRIREVIVQEAERERALRAIPPAEPDSSVE